MKGEYEYEHEMDALDHEAEFMKDELNLHDVDYAKSILLKLPIEEQRGFLEPFLEYVEDWGCAIDAWAENLDETVRHGDERCLIEVTADLLKTYNEVTNRGDDSGG